MQPLSVLKIFLLYILKDRKSKKEGEVVYQLHSGDGQ